MQYILTFQGFTTIKGSNGMQRKKKKNVNQTHYNSFMTEAIII